MTELTKFERRVLDHATRLAVKMFTPTALGMSMGYEHAAASSRVAPAIRTLTAAGLLIRHDLGKNKVVYEATRSTDGNSSA